MKKILLAAAAAACLFATPSFAASAKASGAFEVAQISVNVGQNRRPPVVVHGRRERCQMVETRTRRPNGTVVIRKERRCR